MVLPVFKSRLLASAHCTRRRLAVLEAGSHVKVDFQKEDHSVHFGMLA